MSQAGGIAVLLRRNSLATEQGINSPKQGLPSGKARISTNYPRRRPSQSDYICQGASGAGYSFVDHIIDLAEISLDKSRAYVDRQIRAQVRSYLTGEAMASRHLTASEGRKALRKLDRSFEKIATTLDALSIGQSFVLDAFIKRADGKADAPGLIVARTRLDKMREAIAKTAEPTSPRPAIPNSTCSSSPSAR